MKKSKTIREIPLNEILKGENYRKPQQIEQIAISLKSQGQLEPILAIKKPDGYMILNGYRRYHGMLYANENLKTNFDSIEAILVDEKLEEDDKALLQMVLNEFLDTPLEKAIKISELLDKGMQQKKIAEAFGVKEAYISKTKKRIIRDDVFLAYISNKTIIRVDDKKNNKFYYSDSVTKLQPLLEEKPELMKYVYKLEPGNDSVSVTSLDYIADAYEKLQKDHLNTFHHLIGALQYKKIYDKKQIESMCLKAIEKAGIGESKKETKNESVNRKEIAKKACSMISKIGKYDSETIFEINKEFESLNIPLVISLKQ